MQTININIPQEALAQVEALKNRPIDLSDAPEITDWHGAKRGMFRFHQANQDVRLTDDLFEQDFVAWLSNQPTQTKQKVQDLVRIALNLGHATA